MPTLEIKNVPERLYERLRTKASKDRLSLDEEALCLLQKGLEQIDQEQARLLEEIKANRTFCPAAKGLPDPMDLVREDCQR